MSNAWQSTYNVHLIKGNIITTVVNTNRPTLFSMTEVLQSLSYWETQNQQYSDKDICPYVFAYFVQVYLESKCLEVQRLCVFSIWQILLNCPSKMATSIYTCTHGSIVKTAQITKSNVRAAALLSLMLFKDFSVLAWATENTFLKLWIGILSQIPYKALQKTFILWGSTVHLFKTLSQLLRSKGLPRH